MELLRLADNAKPISWQRAGLRVPEYLLDWLEHWIDRGSINYPMLAHGDPLLEPLRGEPRFRRLLERIRPEWERFVPRFQAAD